MTKAFDISKVRSTLNTQFFASLSGASFYNAETQENSKNAKVEDYDSAMTGVEGDVVLHRLVLPAVKVGGHKADGQAGDAGEQKMEAEGSADLLMFPFFFWEEVREEEVGNSIKNACSGGA